MQSFSALAVAFYPDQVIFRFFYEGPKLSKTPSAEKGKKERKGRRKRKKNYVMGLKVEP